MCCVSPSSLAGYWQINSDSHPSSLASPFLLSPTDRSSRFWRRLVSLCPPSSCNTPLYQRGEQLVLGPDGRQMYQLNNDILISSMLETITIY